MSPSKLDPSRRARDFRVDPEQTRAARHRGGRTNLHHVFKDLTTVTYLQNRDTEDSRYIVLDELPEMTEDWIEKMVVVRSPIGGAPDRMYLGVELSDDSLTWIEISLMSPAPPSIGGGGGGSVVAPTITWTTHLGVGLLDLSISPASGLDVDASGNIWIGSPNDGTGRLKKFSPAGSVLVNIALPLFGGGTAALVGGLAVQQSDGDVWAADTVADRVHHYSTSGVDQTAWNPGTMDNPHGLAFNSGETILAVTDTATSIHHVRFYTFPALTTITTLTSFAFPIGVDFDSSGNIYVGDWGHHVIYKYSPTYVLLDTWGTPDVSGSANGQFYRPYGIHVDSADRVYVADTYNHRVQVFRNDGVFLTSFGGVGTGHGQFQYPVDVTTFGSNLYVADTNNDRISAWTVT